MKLDVNKAAATYQDGKALPYSWWLSSIQILAFWIFNLTFLYLLTTGCSPFSEPNRNRNLGDLYYFTLLGILIYSIVITFSRSSVSIARIWWWRFLFVGNAIFMLVSSLFLIVELSLAARCNIFAPYWIMNDQNCTDFIQKKMSFCVIGKFRDFHGNSVIVTFDPATTTAASITPLLKQIDKSFDPERTDFYTLLGHYVIFQIRDETDFFHPI